MESVNTNKYSRVVHLRVPKCYMLFIPLLNTNRTKFDFSFSSEFRWFRIEVLPARLANFKVDLFCPVAKKAHRTTLHGSKETFLSKSSKSESEISPPLQSSVWPCIPQYPFTLTVCHNELDETVHLVETLVFLFHEKLAPYDFCFGVANLGSSTWYDHPKKRTEKVFTAQTTTKRQCIYLLWASLFCGFALMFKYCPEAKR